MNTTQQATMDEKLGFLNSTAGQVLLIGGVAFGAWFVLKNYGKETAQAVTDTVGTGVSGVYEGSKDFGKEIATDITRIFERFTVTDSNLSKDGGPGYITDSAGKKVGYVAESGKTTYADGYLGGYQDAGTKVIPSIPDSLAISRGMTPQEALNYALGAADVVKPRGQVIDAGTQYLPDSSSTAKLLGQVANAVGYTPANPAVATTAAKIVSSGNPVSQLGGATLAKGVSYTRGGVTYTGG